MVDTSSPSPSGRRASRGFGLLEALVAIVLLAGTGVALMGWLQQNLNTASRLKDRDAISRVTGDARRLVGAIDPVAKPQGRIEAGSLHVQWRASPEQPARTVRPYVVGEAARWRVGLYRLKVDAEDRSDATQVHFEVLQAGMEPLQSAPTQRPDAP